MKKTLSMILALAIILTCCAAFGVSGASAEEEEAQKYVVGDSDLDGDISVIDATVIQRDLASLEEMNGLQKELSDFTDTGIDITCATAIQRYLAGIPTGFSIGEEAGDVNEGVVYAESLPWYVFNTANQEILAIPSDVYFSTAYPDVPFITDSDAINMYALQYMYIQAPVLAPVEGADSAVHTYDLPVGTSVSFDYDRKVMEFSDYTTTLAYNGCMTYNPFSVSAAPETTIYKQTEKDHYYGGDPIIATYGYDEVPMLHHGNDILIPLQSFSDLFFSYVGVFYQYNGKGIFAINAGMSGNPYYKEYWDLYTDTDKRVTISKEWAQVNYYELCNALDVRYGLQSAHNIAYFDEYFARKGLKSRMLSTNLAAIEKAELEMSSMLFEDFHSNSSVVSPFLGDYSELFGAASSPIYENRRKKFAEIVSAREAKLGETVAPYERRGDTVFITFDEFTWQGEAHYYAEGYEPSPDGDTVDLFAYALKRLQNEDSDAKNVVVDIACNGGGTVYACGYVLEAICGKSIICLQNPNTWALHQCVYNYDLNLDGSIDENDVSMLDMGKNVAVNISDHSFSCGNMLPCSLDALDDRILLIGQTSGGGACEVGYLTTSTGAMMQISSECRFVTMKNGYIRDIDGGVSPDVYLSLNRMFDRDYISDIVHDQFG